MIYRTLYIDKNDRLHTKRYSEKNKQNALDEFKLIRKNDSISVRTEVLNDNGVLVSFKEFGPECYWPDYICRHFTLRKMYFAYAISKGGNEEKYEFLSEEEAETIIRNSVYEIGYGTEWVWIPQLEDY